MCNYWLGVCVCVWCVCGVCVCGVCVCGVCVWCVCVWCACGVVVCVWCAVNTAYLCVCWYSNKHQLINMQCMNVRIYINTVGSRFATVRFTTIHFYDPCPVRPNTPVLWCITVATQASFLSLVRFQLFSSVHVFLLILF
jgi:hypothetical protein